MCVIIRVSKRGGVVGMTGKQSWWCVCTHTHAHVREKRGRKGRKREREIKKRSIKPARMVNQVMRLPTSLTT